MSQQRQRQLQQPNMAFTTRKKGRNVSLLVTGVVLSIILLSFVNRLPSPSLSLEVPSFYSRVPKPLPTCSNTKARTFLIVFQSRSGSTAVTTHLKRHSAVHMSKLEYLDMLQIAPGNASGALAETRKFFEEGLAKGLTPGFKIRSYHILPLAQEWTNLAKEFDTRVVWQYRKNVFKSAIGTYQKEVLGDSTAISGLKKDEVKGDRCRLGVGCKFRIEDMAKFHDLLKNRVKYQDLISEAVRVLDGGRGCTWEVPYEDFLYYPADTIRDLQAFMGFTPEATEADRIKATGDSLCDVVENFDELCSNFYACAAWQPYLDDFVNDCRCDKFITGTTQFCAVN